ncbi:MAG: ABC transporter substrate-binding protein [Ruminococcaceae bacterium]|nr:ABC transporter substrate-binding protein [Oscillospiraceae bacterium]
MRRWICSILMIASLLSLVGCGEAEKAYVPTGDGLSYHEDYTGPVETRPQVQAQNMTLTYYPERSLNPIQATDFTNRTLFSLLYQPLFSVDRDYKMEPVLCERYSMSQDMRNYTFYLDPKATFSDGSRVRPEDVCASLQAAMLSSYYSGRFRHFLSITVTEDQGIAVSLSTAYENLPILLDIPIVKESQVDEPRPLGSGPYIWDASSTSLCLRKRANWWCSAELPLSAPMISLVVAESNPQIRDNFQFNGLSLVCTDPGSDKYTDYRSDFELWACESGHFLYLAVSEASSWFSDPDLRKALTYTVDRDKLVQTYYRGFGIAATLPALPTSPYYSQKLAEKYGYDPQVMSKALEGFTHPEYPMVFLVNSDDSLRTRMARSIAETLESYGIAVTMKELSGEAYRSALRERNYDLYLGETKLSANMDLSAFFHTTGALSYGGVDDTATYSLCLQALENHGNYYTLHQTVMEDGMLVPLLSYTYAVYATRGTLLELTPARDNIFYYSLGKTMEGAFIRN